MIREESARIGERGATLFNGCDDCCEVVVEQYQVGRFAGDIGTAKAHGDANVCLLKSGRVIYAITSHCNHMTTLAKGAGDTQLVLRSYTADDNPITVHKGSEYFFVLRQVSAF